jgi:CheY-like chemotaxis protein
VLKKCSFYRNPENIGTGIGLGYCDLDGCQAICEGDIQFCEKPDLLRNQLSKQKEKEVGNNEGKEDQKKELSKYQVLVVDDEEPMRKLIVTLLSQQGYQCITAGNGVEALNKMIQNRCDAVITDIVMPEMDGINLTKKLLSLYPNLPIMVMTGFSQEHPTESALSAGARDFIGKPFSIDEFILRFNKMMRDHEMLCQIEAEHNERFLHLKGNSQK